MDHDASLRLNAHLIKEIEKCKGELVNILQNLVRIPSENPFVKDPSSDSPDEPIELEVANYIFELLSDLGFSPKKVGCTNRPNIVVTLGNGDKTLIFNGHMDTVPVGDKEKWSIDPFSGKIIENKLYGRGAADMKAALASYIIVLRVLSKIENDLNGRLMVQFVVDEEPGAVSEFGTKLLLEKGYTGDFVIIGEPGSYKIVIGHKGGYRFKITTFGESIHTGLREWENKIRGRNAILDMAKVILSLQNVEDEFSVKTHWAFPERKNVVTFPTIINGGTGINIVPDKCEAYGDMRLLPGISLEEIKRKLKERLDKLDVKYELRDLLFVPGVVSNPEHTVVKLLKEYSMKILDRQPKIEGSGPWSDLWHFIVRGIPGVSFGPNGRNMHSYNEYVELESIVKVTQIYALVAKDYLS